MMTSGNVIRILILLNFTWSTLAYDLCCPPGKHLHETKQFCVDGASKQSKLPLNVKFPGIKKDFTCVAYEVYPFDSVEVLESTEEIRVHRYKDPIPSEDYCIDEDNFILCDKCQESGMECINLCCPFDHKFEWIDVPDMHDTNSNENSNSTAIDYDSLSNPCVKSTSSMPALEFHKYTSEGEKKETLNWKEGRDYYYIGPKKMADTEFACPGELTYLYRLSNADDLFIDYKARLHNVIRDEGVADGEKEIVEKDSYCVTHDEKEEVIYMVCSLPEEINNLCEETRKYVFNVGFVLSIIGILISLVTHFLNKVTLRKHGFGQLCVIYLMNMLGQYIVITIERFGSFQSETASCEAIGYLQQYFYLSFFFSLSALGYTSYRMIKTMNNSGSFFDFPETDKREYIKFCLGYIQGVPLLITIMTYMIDSIRKQRNIRGDQAVSYPEMAVYQGSCYFGYQNPDKSNRPSYFITPEFIYVQSFQLLIIITNFVLFVLTVKAYMNNVVKPALKDKHKENLVTLARLYCFSIGLWFMEIVTSGIAADYGINETCPLRFVLDCPNAFFGLFAFYIMIASRPTVRREIEESLVTISFDS